MGAGCTRRRSLPSSWFVVASGCCSLLLGQKAELAHRCMTARRRVRRLFAVLGEVRRCFSSSLLASLHQRDSSLSCKRKLVVASRERQLLLRQEVVHHRIRKPITVAGSSREETIRREFVHRQAASPKEVDAADTEEARRHRRELLVVASEGVEELIAVSGGSCLSIQRCSSLLIGVARRPEKSSVVASSNQKLARSSVIASRGSMSCHEATGLRVQLMVASQQDSSLVVFS